MRLPLAAIGATLLLTSSALCQIGIPPHATVYNGFTRGFNFTANTAFDIVQMELPPDAFMPGDTAGYMILVNGTEVFRQVGVAPGANGAGTVGVSLPPIIPGDVVDILGNWSPAVTGNFTAHNSYGNTAPFATTIEGVAHTLNRNGWQWDIADPGYTGGSLLAPTTGSIGRVLVYTAPPSGTLPPSIVGVAEAIPTTGTLAGTGGIFTDNDFIRWNYDDSLSAGANNGTFAVTSVNFGSNGPPVPGVTVGLPGLVNTWAGSTPVGFSIFTGPSFVGQADQLLVIPPGFFSNAQSMRFQAVMLDPGNSPLPARVMFNALTFTYLAPWNGQENFDSGTTLPLGWTNKGPNNWTVDANGTGSTGTGPTAASSLPNYLYTETSIAHPGFFCIETPPVASSSAPNSRLDFSLSRIGAAIGTLNILMEDINGTFVQVAQYVGPDPLQSQGGVEWSAESIDLTVGGTVTVPANIVIRFEHSGTTSFTADVAIDDVNIN